MECCCNRLGSVNLNSWFNMGSYYNCLRGPFEKQQCYMTLCKYICLIYSDLWSKQTSYNPLRSTLFNCMSRGDARFLAPLWYPLSIRCKFAKLNWWQFVLPIVLCICTQRLSPLSHSTSVYMRSWPTLKQIQCKNTEWSEHSLEAKCNLQTKCFPVSGFIVGSNTDCWEFYGGWPLLTYQPQNICHLQAIPVSDIRVQSLNDWIQLLHAHYCYHKRLFK